MNTIGLVSSCDWCNTSFTKKKDDHRFCQTRCRKKWHRKNNGEPLIPDFIGTVKKKARRAVKSISRDNHNIVHQVPITPTLSPKIAELQTKINWLESQKNMLAGGGAILYGIAGAAISRFFTKDLTANLIIGAAGFIYGKSQSKNSDVTRQLQNANIQRQIDELKTEIVKEKDRIKNIPPPPSTNHDDFKLISASRVNELNHEKYVLDGKWKYFLEYMPHSFNGIIYGLPKAGKTHLAIQFAQYLQNKFGDVLYISGEEGIEEPFKNKLIRYNSAFEVAYEVKGSFGIAQSVKKINPKFVFIDSLNRLGLNVDDIIKYKEIFPDIVFIYIMQSTKEGNFKGSQNISHEVTSVIKVVEGIAYQEGRTVPGGTEIPVFKQ